jgi:hypothetical protein
VNFDPLPDDPGSTELGGGRVLSVEDWAEIVRHEVACCE